MSNLGNYQIMTTLAKKVGGPVKLALCTMSVGYMIGKGGERVIKKIISSKKGYVKKVYNNKIYTVILKTKNNEGIEFDIGDRFRVLEIDKNVAIIEIIGRDDNPYVVEIEVLCEISDFKVE